jgi:hypothetical protein
MAEESKVRANATPKRLRSTNEGQGAPPHAFVALDGFELDPQHAANAARLINQQQCEGS